MNKDSEKYKIVDRKFYRHISEWKNLAVKAIMVINSMVSFVS